MSDQGNDQAAVDPRVLEQRKPRPRREEQLNAASHGLGVALSLMGAIWILGRIDRWGYLQFALLGYCVTLVGMYTFSSLSHWVDEPQRKHQLRVWDQGFIYLLIAGTYTPFIANHVDGAQRAIYMTLLWASAVGLLLQKVVRERNVIDFSAFSYLMLGWIPAMVLIPNLPLWCLLGLLAGGVVYSAGVYFLLRDRARWYFHTIWHFAVIAASAAHFATIWNDVF